MQNSFSDIYLKLKKDVDDLSGKKTYGPYVLVGVILFVVAIIFLL